MVAGEGKRRGLHAEAGGGAGDDSPLLLCCVAIKNGAQYAVVFYTF